MPGWCVPSSGAELIPVRPSLSFSHISHLQNFRLICFTFNLHLREDLFCFYNPAEPNIKSPVQMFVQAYCVWGQLQLLDIHLQDNPTTAWGLQVFLKSLISCRWCQKDKHCSLPNIHNCSGEGIETKQTMVLIIYSSW